MELPQSEDGWGTIVADPPWPYDTRVNGSRALPAQSVKDGTRLQRPVSDWTYDPMPMSEIAGLPVKTIAAKNAHLYLWVTNSFMREGFEVMSEWGFKFTTILTWVKVKRETPLVPSMKSGYWYRGATEHVLFGTRGSCPKPSLALPTAYIYPRINRHSEKPEPFYTDYVEKVSPAPRLEMFARTRRDGWTSWGNQL